MSGTTRREPTEPGLEAARRAAGGFLLAAVALLAFAPVAEAQAPSVQSMTSPTADGTYGPGATIDIAVTFSETVLVTGEPTLELETGATDRLAVYQSGSNTATLTFRYTVQTGDYSRSQLTHTGTDALALPSGATIRDADGNDAVLTLPGPGTANSLTGGATTSSFRIGPPPVIVSPAGTAPSRPTFEVRVDAVIIRPTTETVWVRRFDLSGGSCPARAWEDAGVGRAVASVAVTAAGTHSAAPIRTTSDGTYCFYALYDFFVSAPVQLTIGASSTAPGPPRSLSATANGQTQIDLSWTAPSSNGGSAITGYKIEVSSDGGTNFTDLEADTGSTSTTYSHSGLSAGTTRHYKVSAINAVGTGSASNVDSARTDVAVTAPGPPRSLSATANGQTQIDLSWTAPSSNGGSAITGYKIEVSSDGGTSFTDLEADTGSTSTTYSHSGLSAGTTRHYRVSAINAVGTGSASNVDSARTDVATPTDVPPTVSISANPTTVAPGGVVRLTASASDPDGGTVTYAWSQTSGTAGTFGATDRASVTWTAPSTTGSAQIQVTVTDDENDTASDTATISVREGGGTPEEPEEPEEPSGGPPTAPRSLEAMAGDKEVLLSWQAPTDDGDGRITRYEYRQKAGRGSFGGWTIIRDRGGEESHVRTRRHRVTGLTNGTRYTFVLRAVNSGGRASPPSEPATATPEEELAVPALPLLGQLVLTLLLAACGVVRRRRLVPGA